MTGFTNAEELRVLNFYFRGVAFTPDTPKWLGLFSAPSNDDGTYIEVTAAQWDTYARLQVADADFDAAVGGDPSYCQNNKKLTWLTNGAGTGVTVTHWGLFNAETINTGTMRYHNIINLPSGGLAVNPGVQPEFAIGAFRMNLGDLPAA